MTAKKHLFLIVLLLGCHTLLLPPNLACESDSPSPPQGKAKRR